LIIHGKTSQLKVTLQPGWRAFITSFYVKNGQQVAFWPQLKNIILMDISFYSSGVAHPAGLAHRQFALPLEDQQYS
jgi:hypothetical protein